MTHRAYTIARDAAGQPVRLIWSGDYRRVLVARATCPICSATPLLVAGRCLTCWGDWHDETQWVRG